MTRTVPASAGAVPSISAVSEPAATAGGNDADDLAVRERERQPGDALGANAVELQGRVPACRPVPRRVALR